MLLWTSRLRQRASVCFFFRGAAKVVLRTAASAAKL